ncbi:MAG: polysaccharide deacetylase family protein [Deltaproteobacteria bacterium]
MKDVPLKRRLLCCIVIIAVLAVVTPVTTSYYNKAVASTAPAIHTANTTDQIPVAEVEAAAPEVMSSIVIPPVVKTRNNLPILMYHQVGDGPNSLFVRDTEFYEQMKYLHDNQYMVVSLAEAAQMLKNKSIPEKTVALTFDDGYQTFYDKVWPVLKQYSFNATVFVITDKVDSAPFMNWDEIKTLSDSGVEIGCHTRTHPSLKSLASNRLGTEILQSRSAIEGNTETAVQTFCYPSGEYRQKAVDLIRQNGYTAAVTTKYGTAGYNNDMYLLPRVRISRGLTLQEFAARIK